MMSNPLFDVLGGQKSTPMANLIAEVKRLQRTFQGNPKDEVQKMLSNGTLSQEQFNQYAQIADQALSSGLLK